MNTVYVGTLGSARSAELSPVVQGSTESLHTITVKYADDSTAYNLTGKTVTGMWWRQNDPSTVYDITGTISVTDAANGVFTWDKSAADVGTADRLQVQFVITDDGDAETDATFPARMDVTARGDANAVSAPAYVGILEAVRTWLQSLYASIGGVTSASEDNVLTFDGDGIPQDSGISINALGGGGAVNLGGLSDVTITTPQDGDLLYRDSGGWINGAPGDAGVAAASHDHDADYAAIGHDHDGDYEPAGLVLPYDVQLGFDGVPGDSDEDFIVVGRDCIFKRTNPSTNAVSGYAYASTAPDATATFELYHNATKIEEIEWNTTDDEVGSFVGDIAATDVAISAGDRLRLVAPASADASLADIRVAVRLEVDRS